LVPTGDNDTGTQTVLVFVNQSAHQMGGCLDGRLTTCC
jgi:hypothetical protein